MGCSAGREAPLDVRRLPVGVPPFPWRLPRVRVVVRATGRTVVMPVFDTRSGARPQWRSQLSRCAEVTHR